MDPACRDSWERTAERLSFNEYVYRSTLQMRICAFSVFIKAAGELTLALPPRSLGPQHSGLGCPPPSLSPAPSPQASGSFHRDLLLFANRGQTRKWPFSLISGWGSTTASCSDRRVGGQSAVLKSKLSHGNWDKSAGSRAAAGGAPREETLTGMTPVKRGRAPSQGHFAGRVHLACALSRVLLPPRWSVAHWVEIATRSRRRRLWLPRHC